MDITTDPSSMPHSSHSGYTTRESHLKRLGLEDETAWIEFYEKYRAMIFGIGATQNLSAHECEDLLQEVAIICCKKLQNFVYDPAKCRFRSFLFKVTKNIAFNINRKTYKKNQVPLNDDYPAIPELDLKFMHEYEQFLLEKSFLILKNSIDSKNYLAFDMIFRQNIPIKEVVSKTGMSVSALYTNKHRCLKRLQKIISEMSLMPGIPEETDAEVE